MTLLGPDGSPISSRDHARPRKNAGKPAVGEITGTWQGDYSAPYLSLPGGVTVQFDTSRLTLGDFRRMSEHPQIASSLNLLTFMVHQFDYQLEGGTERVRRHCEENLEHIWTPLIRSLSSSFRFGFSANAVQWENQPGTSRLWINKIKDLVPEYASPRWKEEIGAPLYDDEDRPIIDHATGRQKYSKVQVFNGIRIEGDYPVPVENCVAPDTKVLCADLEWRRADELTVGQKIVAFDEHDVHYGRRYRTSDVEVVKKVVRDSVTVETALGEPITLSKKHPVLVRFPADKVGNRRDPETGRMMASDLGRPPRYRDCWEWVDAGDLAPGDNIAYLSDTWSKINSFDAGYIAAAFDGEGHLTRSGSNSLSLAFTQRFNPMLDRVMDILDRHGFKYNAYTVKRKDERDRYMTITIGGGRPEIMRFLGTFDCVRVRRDLPLEELWEGVRFSIDRNVQLSTVTSVTEVGEIDLISLQTSTRTLITNGYLTHNSLWHSLLMENGNMYGTRLLRTAFRPWFFHNLVMLFANSYYERFGNPLPIGRAPYDEKINVGTTENPVYQSAPAVMRDVLESIRNRSVVVLPSDRTAVNLNDKPEHDYQLELLEGSLRGAEFEKYLAYLNEEMSLALFTPSLLMRTGTSGSYNQGIIHMTVWQNMLNALSADFAQTINRYVLRPMARHNFGKNAEPPKIVFRKLGRADATTMRGIAQELIRSGRATVDYSELGAQIGLSVAEVEELRQDPVDDPDGSQGVNRSDDPRIARGGHQDTDKTSGGTDPNNKSDAKLRAHFVEVGVADPDHSATLVREFVAQALAIGSSAPVEQIEAAAIAEVEALG